MPAKHFIPELTEEELKSEEWHDVVSHKGIYSASNLGRIRRDAPSLRKCGASRPGRLLKPAGRQRDNP